MGSNSSKNNQPHSIFHCHHLEMSQRPFFCDICLEIYRDQNHYICQECNFDICMFCYNGNNPLPIYSFKRSLFTLHPNIKKIINQCRKKAEIEHDLSHIIERSRPSLYLFKEQSIEPNFNDYKLVGTNKYIDENGNTIIFFSSDQASRNIQNCQRSIDRYFSVHSIQLFLNKDSERLKELNGEELTVSDIALTYVKYTISGALKGYTLYISHFLEKKMLSPIFEKASSSLFFKKGLIHVTNRKLEGCEVRITNDDDIYPCYENLSTRIVPDHNMTFDWSTINSLPSIISIIINIRQLFPNCKMERRYDQLNMLYGAIDYIEKGLSEMKNNPYFNREDKKVINFAYHSAQSLLIYMRLTPIPLTLLRTTIINVYQTSQTNGDSFHAFFSQNDFFHILDHLVPDIREVLIEISENQAFNFEVNDISNTIMFLNAKILRAEAVLAKFLKDTANTIYNVCAMLINAYIASLNCDYSNILNIIDAIINNQPISNRNNNDQRNPEQNNNYEQIINQFINQYSNSIRESIKNAIQRHIIPAFYTNDFLTKQKLVVDLKHYKELVCFAAQIHRRKNDNLQIFKIDLEIEKSQECAYVYRINTIL